MKPLASSLLTCRKEERCQEMFELQMQGFVVRFRSKGFQEQDIGSLYSVKEKLSRER